MPGRLGLRALGSAGGLPPAAWPVYSNSKIRFEKFARARFRGGKEELLLRQITKNTNTDVQTALALEPLPTNQRTRLSAVILRSAMRVAPLNHRSF